MGPHSLIFSELSSRDLIRLSHTCLSIRVKVLNTCYNINTLISPFFPGNDHPDLVGDFRRLQAQTGALISGSIALQFFLRTSSYPEKLYSTSYESSQSSSWGADSGDDNPMYRLKYGEDGRNQYENSDMDLYVGLADAYEVAAFLHDVAGYTFKNRSPQVSDWSTEVKATRPPEDRKEAIFNRTYHGRGIANVMDWYQETDEDVEIPWEERQRVTRSGTEVDMIATTRKKRLKIQMIVSEQTPLDIILTYHSSKHGCAVSNTPLILINIQPAS